MMLFLEQENEEENPENDVTESEFRSFANGDKELNGFELRDLLNAKFKQSTSLVLH